MGGRYNPARPGHGNQPVLDVTSLGNQLTLIESKEAELTHALATTILELKEFVGDRKLKQGHVDHLALIMKRGTFHPEWVTLIVCELDGETYRMNGQHTCWARIEMHEDWPCKVRCMRYKAGSMDDMRQLYASIDRGSPRTKRNVLESYLKGSSEFDRFKASSMKHVPAGFAMFRWPTAHERNQHDGDDVAYLLRTESHDLASKVCAFLDDFSAREQRHIFRASVVAAMFATFQKAEKQAREFWKPVGDGVGIEQRGDVRNKLRTSLMQTAVSLGAGATQDRRGVSAEYMIRMCITCWNAFREGRTLQSLRVNEKGPRPRIK